MSENINIRVRFAPSPTGALHIGGVRTALYDYALAKKHKGVFILRIEDTDQKRFVPGAEKYIYDTLKWLGIEPDEGPMQGGEAVYYRQSERIEIYKPYITQLIEQGHAYYAFDTTEELDEMRKRLEEAKVSSPKYNVISREWMRNSLVMSSEEVKELLDKGAPYVVRLKVPHKQFVRFYDKVRGWIKINSEDLDDKVLMKSDGIPTYHFANVVDDYLMRISHVIRGEEWISSTPIHILLYQYLNWESAMPQFVHLPLLLKPDGVGKLSKRAADYSFPVFPISWVDPNIGMQIEGFREQGYLPETLINFLALLGWNPGNNQEIFDINEFIQLFSLERLGNSAVKFDINKAKWFNQYYIRKSSDDVLIGYLTNDLKLNNLEFGREYILKICTMLKDRITFAEDFWKQGKFFFIAPTKQDYINLDINIDHSIIKGLEEFILLINDSDTFSAEMVKSIFSNLVRTKSLNLGKAMVSLRYAVTCNSSGPDLMSSIEIIGKPEVIKRIQLFLDSILSKAL